MIVVMNCLIQKFIPVSTYCRHISNVYLRISVSIETAIAVVMVSRLASSMVDHGFIQPWSCQTKDSKTIICCIYIKQAALRSKSKALLAWSQDIPSLPPSNTEILKICVLTTCQVFSPI